MRAHHINNLDLHGNLSLNSGIECKPKISHHFTSENPRHYTYEDIFDICSITIIHS